MLSKYVSILLLTATLFGIIHCQEKYFRNDYKYIKDTRSYYKIHTLVKTWEDAKEKCESEGASLFYPENVEEAEIVRSYWNETQPSIDWVYIGIASWIVPEVFDTIDGRPMSDVYDAWSPGEPDNASGVESCVLMSRDVGLKDDPCDKRFPFICKKNVDTLQWNTECNMPDLQYKYISSLNRCYKYHLKPKNWTEAYTTCRAEQSYLAIVNSKLESDQLVNLMQNTNLYGVTGDYVGTQVLLGFKKKTVWTTISGVPLDQSGYMAWQPGYPDNMGGNENCGGMFNNGLLNDIGCFQKMLFICEHEIKNRSENKNIAYRFNSN